MKQFVTKNFLLIILILAVGFAFAMQVTIFQKPSTTPPPTTAVLPAAFAAYWPTGVSERNIYQLEQAQNGALHTGEAILTFTAEDFRTDTQVRATTDAGREKSIPVLETTLTKRFVIKGADHMLQTAVFTPAYTRIDQPALFLNTLKVSTSEQTEAGHSSLQLAYHTNEYRVIGKSYLEPEADEDYTVPKAMLEDELWNRLRMDPSKLPVGDVQLIPGSMSARLRHKRLEPLAAKARLEPYEGILFPGTSLQTYAIEYPTDNRTVRLIFEGKAPYKIVGWEETYKSNDNLLTSRAVLKKTTQSNSSNANPTADTTRRVGSTK